LNTVDIRSYVRHIHNRHFHVGDDDDDKSDDGSDHSDDSDSASDSDSD